MSAVAGNVEILADIPFFLWILEDIAEALLIQNSFDISDDYLSLAKNYYKIYQTQRNFYYNNFQDGGSDTAYTERGLLNQVFNNPLQGNGQTGISYVPQYTQQANNAADFSNRRLSNPEWWVNHANMYNDTNFIYGLDAYGANIAIGSPSDVDNAAKLDDFDTYLYRYEEHRKDVYDERTWEWQNQVLNFAVKQASVVESGLATSFKFLNSATNTMADFFATQANGVSKYAAFRKSYTDVSQQLRA